MSEFTKDESAVNPPDEYEKNDIERLIKKILEGALDEKELQIINSRFGLIDRENELSLDEISKIFGVTRERIRQIEAKILRKLSNPRWDYAKKLRELY